MVPFPPLSFAFALYGSITQPFLGSCVLAPPLLPGSLVQLLSPYSPLSATWLSLFITLVPGYVFLKALLQRYTNLGLPPILRRGYSALSNRLLVS